MYDWFGLLMDGKKQYWFCLDITGPQCVIFHRQGSHNSTYSLLYAFCTSCLAYMKLYIYLSKTCEMGSCHKLHSWNRALIIHPDIKLKSCVFIVTQPPGIALNWNIPICFFPCANMSDWVKMRTDLSDSEAVVWSHTVSTIQCHVHMLGWVYPHFQLSCDGSHKKHIGVSGESMKYKPGIASVSYMCN